MPVSKLPHPELERLNSFGLGLLSEADSAELELHLGACEECRQKLEHVPADALVDLLQASEADTPSNLSPALQTIDSSVQASPPSSVPPLYKRLANILHVQPADQALPVAAAKVAAFSSGIAIPSELEGHARYEVLEPLGAGGMGVVYKARHRLMDRMVALKVVNPLLVTQPGSVERFVREVKAAAQLGHANIVTAFDAETIGKMHVLVMEYVEGETLGQLLNSHVVLPVEQACDYVRQTALGLQHALERGMVHRDIKPLNLMLTRQGSVKILDFGLARFVSEERSPDGSTQQGSMMGSPDYMAPEQARDAHSADSRADIYSMGCTLYQLLAGQVPFPGLALLEKLEAHRDQQPLALNQLRADVPAELERIVARMMAKNPADRFQTPADVAQALLPFTKAQPLPAPAVEKRPPLAASRAPLYALTAVAALLLAVVAYWVAQIVLRVETPQGTLIVPTDDPDVQVSVKSGGKEVGIYFPQQKQEIPLKIGEYTIELVGGKEGMKLSSNHFRIESGKGKTVTVEFIPKVARQLKDVVNYNTATMLVNDNFSDPTKSAFGWGNWAGAFKDGRMVHTGQGTSSWGDSVHATDVDLVCELKGRILVPPGQAWGLAVINPAQEKEKLPVRGVEVVVDSKGEVRVEASRYVEDDALKISRVGPVRAARFNQGTDQNLLTLILRKGRTLEVFVNGEEVCDPVRLKQHLSPVHFQLVVNSDDKQSTLAFESFKVWSLSTGSALPSVEELLRTREVLTVAQDGTGDFTTIQAALDKVQANQVVLIKGRGPYHETPSKQLPANVSLISQEGTFIEVGKYTPQQNPAWASGAQFQVEGWFCMSGLNWVGLPPPISVANGFLVDVRGPADVVVENCSFGGDLPKPWFLGLNCVVAADNQRKALVQNNHFSRSLQMVYEHGELVIQRNWFGGKGGPQSNLHVRHSGSVTFRNNVVQNHAGLQIAAEPIDKARAQPGVDIRIDNNVFDVAGTSLGLWSNPPADEVLPRSVQITNNVFRSGQGQGILVRAEWLEKVKTRWRVGPNAYAADPQGGSFFDNGVEGVAWPKSPQDLIVSKPFLSDDSADTNYMRISAEGLLAKGGAGGELPAYMGAFPPGPAPKEGDWFTRLHSLAATGVKELLAKARTASEQKKFEEAVNTCSEILRLEPNNIEATYLRAWPQWNLGKTDLAIQDVSSVLKVNPDHYDARHNRTWYYLSTNRLDECIADADIILAKDKINRGAAGAFHYRGVAWAQKGRLDKGLADCEIAVKLDPAPALYHQWLGMIQAQLGDHAKAKAAFDTALTLDKSVATYGKEHLDHFIAQPTPLAEWRIGREFVTVAQKGPADHRTIQDALNAVKEGQYVKVLDQGPYRETIVHNRPIADFALVSDVGTRIEVPHWHEWGVVPWDKTKKFYEGCVLTSPNGLRLSGFEFRLPPLPPDTHTGVAVEFSRMGDLIVEACQVRYHRDVLAGLTAEEKSQFGQFVGLNIRSFDEGAGKERRFLVQDNLIDGKVQLNSDGPVQATVQRNWIRTLTTDSLLLPFHAQTECDVRHNIIQGYNGIALRARESEKDAATSGRYLITNNFLDVDNCPFWGFGPPAIDDKERQGREALSHAVTFQNNIIHSRSKSGVELHADDLKVLTGVWKVDHNCFSAEPKHASPTNFPVFASQPTDLIVAGPFLSEDVHDLNYLRILAEGKLARGGVGGILPSYIGPLPPGPAPKEGDWFTRVLKLARESAPAAFAWPANALREGRIPAPDLTKGRVLYRNEFKKPEPDAGFGATKGDHVETGIRDGKFFIAVKPGAFAGCWSDRGPFPEFAAEAVGRVAEPSVGQWWLEVHNLDQKRGLHFRLNGGGELEIADSLFGGETRTIGRHRHPAIKKGDAFNKILLIVKGKRIEIYVNDIAVCDPIALEITMPAQIALGAASVGNREVRAEIEHVIVRSAEGLPMPEERFARGEVPLVGAVQIVPQPTPLKQAD